MNNSIQRIRRLIKKPPDVIIHRLYQEFRGQIDPFLMPIKSKHLALPKLLKILNQPNLDNYWTALSKREYPAQTSNISLRFLQNKEPEVFQNILDSAELAINHKNE